MIQVIGHSAVVSALTMDLPKNTLIIGPRSVGKRTIFESMVQKHNIGSVLRFYDMDAAALAEIQAASLESSDFRGRIIFIRLGFPKKALVEKLLKIVEDAPDLVRFFVTTTANPDFTLRTRFTTYEVGFLAQEELARILTKKGVTSDKAVELAQKGFGTVGDTLAVVPDSVKSLVTEALKQITERSENGVDALYKRWDDDHTKLLKVWASERITGQWRVFNPEVAPDLGKGVALSILKKVDPFDRPRFVVRNSLVGVVRERRNK